jgi:long-subunit acyl-CoA synthetase (AMP-forming)
VDATTGAVLTDARLAEDVDRCAAGLPARGLAPGEVRGAQLMLGYLGDEAATATALTGDGRLRTGDIATIDEAGRVVSWIASRN